jgi:uncharacterized protein (TIGR03382 family)
MGGVVGILALLAAQGAPNPEGYWKLDAETGTTATDSSGNGHTGTLMAGAAISTIIPTVPPNNHRSVALVNATNNMHVNVPSSAAFDFTTGFTLACWVRPTGTPNTQMGLIERWSSGTSAINGYLLRMGRIGDPATAHNIKINVGNGTTGIEAAHNTAMPLNTWTHVAATWDGTNLRLYRNGSMVAMNSAGAGAVTSSGVPLEIGQSGPHRLQGNIDEVYTFNTALTQAQIGILVNGQPPPTAPLTVTQLVNELSVSWGAAPDALSYNVYRSDNGGAFNLIANVAALSYTDTTATYPGTYSYRITALGYMESTPLGPVSGTPFSPIPRTNDHEEGFLDDNCACGSTIPPAALPWAALALLAAFRRRR